MTYKPCLVCGEVSEGRRCEACAPSATELRVTSPRERGYDAAWDRLSRTARRLQPWCSDCGTEERLTADHLPSAWERKAAGLPLRLEDVEVVCAPCNLRRGTSRPGSERAATWGVTRPSGSSGPGRKAGSPTLSARVARTTPDDLADDLADDTGRRPDASDLQFSGLVRSSGR